jgi:hypothetical protein
MDPKLNLTYRRTQVHSAELQRRAALDRQAARARTSGREAGATTPSGLRLGGLADAARVTFARARSVVRRTPALGSKTERG